MNQSAIKSDENTQSSSFRSFIDYKNVVNTLITDLDKLRDFYQKLKLDIKLIDEVLKRTQADSFSVAVVGEFKRGKSTFINALLGKEILPSDILPCSATLNRVKYSLTPSVTVTFKNGREEQIAIEQLANYVTKLTEESEQTAASVKEAVVYYPVPFCKNNVEIIDTPGLNDDTNMTEVTLSVLPQVDAAILVVMAQAPFGEYERDFLENKLLSNDLGRVIFVVTGIDRFNRPEDADKVIKHIEERIQKYVLKRAEEQFGKNSTNYEVYLKKIGKPKVFGLSAYQYLEGKHLNDSALIVSSRFEPFVSGLETFLTEDRGSIVLQVPVNRVIASSTEVLKAINIQESALSMDKEKFEAKISIFEDFHKLTDIRITGVDLAVVTSATLEDAPWTNLDTLHLLTNVIGIDEALQVLTTLFLHQKTESEKSKHTINYHQQLQKYLPELKDSILQKIGQTYAQINIKIEKQIEQAYHSEIATSLAAMKQAQQLSISGEECIATANEQVQVAISLVKNTRSELQSFREKLCI